MAIESSVSKALYIGNGTAKEFPFAFKVWDAGHVQVVLSDATESDTDVTQDVTITLTDTGGTVTFAEAPQVGHKVAIVRNMPFLQEDRYITGTRFDPHEIEEALDIACAERQQLREKLDRAVTVGVSSSRTPTQYSDDFFAMADQVREDRNFVEAEIEGFDNTVAAKTTEVVASVESAGAAQVESVDAAAADYIAHFNKLSNMTTTMAESPTTPGEVSIDWDNDNISFAVPRGPAGPIGPQGPAGTIETALASAFFAFEISPDGDLLLNTTDVSAASFSINSDGNMTVTF